MITIIAAVSSDGFIGQHGKIPWRLKSDMEHFKSITAGHTVVMGRKTWESLPPKFKPLRDRRNIILTHQPDFSAGGAEIVPSLEQALEITDGDEEVFIMGGSEVYRQAMPVAERLLITHVHTIVGEQGDALFPGIDPNAWNLATTKKRARTDGDEHDFHIAMYSPNLRYIEMANVRPGKMMQEYRRIRKDGHCPFCPSHLSVWHKKPVLHKGEYWTLTTSDYPYPDTASHLLLILNEHEESFGTLPIAAQHEFCSIVTAVETEGKFPGGAICGRSGDPLRSGASVKHLHFHLIVPSKAAGQVAFYLGTRKVI